MATHLRVKNDDLGLVIKWNTNWKVYDDANLSNKLSQKEKVDLRSKIEVCLRRIYLDLPVSVLTTEHKITLNIKWHSNDSSSLISLVDFSPRMIGKENEHLYQTLRLQNPKTPDSMEMPHGHWIYLEILFGKRG